MFSALGFLPAPAMLPGVEEKAQVSVRRCLKTHAWYPPSGSWLCRRGHLGGSLSPQKDLAQAAVGGLAGLSWRAPVSVVKSIPQERLSNKCETSLCAGQDFARVNLLSKKQNTFEERMCFPTFEERVYFPKEVSSLLWIK